VLWFAAHAAPCMLCCNDRLCCMALRAVHPSDERRRCAVLLVVLLRALRAVLLVVLLRALRAVLCCASTHTDVPGVPGGSPGVSCELGTGLRNAAAAASMMRHAVRLQQATGQDC
jgi:hypothetical protein